MRQFTSRVTFVALLVLTGVPPAIAQSPATDFELSVTTTADRTVSVQCVRGCKLVVGTVVELGGEVRWKAFPVFSLEKCQSRECSSGQVLGGVVTQSPSPDFDLWVASRAEATVIKCVRGCKFAAVAGAPSPDAPEPMRVQEVQFPCSRQTCASGRISGWVEQDPHITSGALPRR